jgi:hypothetical protein
VFGRQYRLSQPRGLAGAQPVMRIARLGVAAFQIGRRPRTIVQDDPSNERNTGASGFAPDHGTWVDFGTVLRAAFRRSATGMFGPTDKKSPDEGGALLELESQISISLRATTHRAPPFSGMASRS